MFKEREELIYFYVLFVPVRRWESFNWEASVFKNKLNLCEERETEEQMWKGNEGWKIFQRKDRWRRKLKLHEILRDGFCSVLSKTCGDGR